MRRRRAAKGPLVRIESWASAAKTKALDIVAHAPPGKITGTGRKEYIIHVNELPTHIKWWCWGKVRQMLSHHEAQLSVVLNIF